MLEPISERAILTSKFIRGNPSPGDHLLMIGHHQRESNRFRLDILYAGYVQTHFKDNALRATTPTN